MQVVEEMRLAPRTQGTSLMVEIPLSIPKDNTMRFQVHDISDGGLSFLVPGEYGFFYKDTVLENLKLYNKDTEVFIDRVRVVYCLSDYVTSEVSRYYKVGITFLHEEGMHPKIRGKRFPVEMLGSVKGKVTVQAMDGTVYDGKLVDFSLYGVSFAIKKTGSIPNIGSVVELKIMLGDKIVYNGKGVIKTFQETRDSLILRVNLTTDVFALDTFVGLRLEERIKDEEKIVNSVFENIGNINSDYKAIIADIAYVLSSVKRRLDAFENELPKDDEKMRNTLVTQMFASLEGKVFPRMIKLSDKLDELANGLNQEEQEIYRNYFQKILHPLTFGANLANRVYNKPLGFPGDYEMMNMLARNAREGLSLYDQFVHRFFCWVPSSQANRNRSKYMYDKLQGCLTGNINTQKITSIACGSAIEIQELIKRDIKLNIDTITLVDFDRDSLDYTQKTLYWLMQKNKIVFNVKFIQESMFDMVRKKECLDKIADNQDIIYSMGFFEYLNASTCKLIIKLLYSKLSHGGMMIIGNYGEGTPFRAFMELGYEWYLIYRSNKELLQLADGILETEKLVTIEQEPLGFIKFLVITKRG